MFMKDSKVAGHNSYVIKFEADKKFGLVFGTETPEKVLFPDSNLLLQSRMIISLDQFS